MSAFYKNYVEQCAKKKKSPSAVAEEIGLSRTSPNGWKKGKQPSDVNIQKLSEYFGVSVAYLRGEEEQKENPTAQEGSEALKDAGYYRLNEDNKAFIDQMIEKLLKAQSGE